MTDFLFTLMVDTPDLAACLTVIAGFVVYGAFDVLLRFIVGEPQVTRLNNLVATVPASSAPLDGERP